MLVETILRMTACGASMVIPIALGDLFGDLELRVLDVLYRYLAWSLVDHYPVVSH